MITRSNLSKLSSDCAKLLFYSERFESDNASDIREDNRTIRQALRKIIIANEISDRMIICVTGLQGVGKTTLIKNFYGLDNDDVNISLGQGEQLPVLITESDVNQVEMYAVGLKKGDKSYEKEKTRINKTEFVEYSKAEDEDTTIMFLEMLVPAKYFGKNSNISFMLLPGYERNPDSYWETLIDFSVECSDTAIFVMTPDSVASAANADLIGKIKDEFGSKVIYAISHSDEKSDNNENIKKTLMELVEASSTEDRRFVCTGSYIDEEKNEAWRNQLKNAIEEYSVGPGTVDQKSKEYVLDIISEDLRPAAMSIRRQASDNTSDLLTDFQQSAWIKAFDNETEKLRKRLKKNLKEKIKISYSKDREKLIVLLKERSKLRSIRRTLVGQNLTDIQKAKELIENAMKDSDGTYRYQQAFVQSIESVTDQLCLPDKRKDENSLELEISRTAPLEIMKKSDEKKRIIVQDMVEIFTPEEKGSKHELRANPADTMRAISECATQYFGLAITDELYVKQYINAPKLAKSDLTMESIKESINNSQKFAMTVLGVTGLDLLGDGVLNFIPKLAESLKVATPVVGAFTMAFVGAGAYVAFMKDYNKLQLEDEYSYSKAIGDVYSNLENTYLDFYDDYMNEVRDRINKYLIQCVGVNDDVLNRQNALIAIKNIVDNLDDVSKELTEKWYEPTKLING